MGTVRSTGNYETENKYNPVVFRPSPSDLQSQQVSVLNPCHFGLWNFCKTLNCAHASFLFKQVFLKDTDERACAYIAGPAPNRWGFTVDGKDLFQSIIHISTNDGKFMKSGIRF